MPKTLSTTTIDELAKRLKEPSWLTELRQSALKQHSELPWPHPSDEIWRRTNVSLLDPMQGFRLADEPGLLQAARMNNQQLHQFTQPLDAEHLIVRADGAWMSRETPQGVVVTEVAQAAQEHHDVIRPLLEADGLTPQERKLTSLNTAFHHDDLMLQISPNVRAERPIRLVRLVSVGAKQAVFPLTVILVGRGSAVTLIDEYVGLAPESPALLAPPVGGAQGGQAGEAHVINSRIELILEPGSSVSYVRIQRWHPAAREFLLQRATLQEGAQLTLVNINLGAALSKAHVITKLLGPQATSKLYGFVFGHGRQHIDQHTLQDHQAPHTMSDLLFKAALKEESRMIYTGLIRIAKSAKQTDAYQANHNLLLSRQAKAETIPMLEILADDVRCKHAATIGPIDDEQAFYLMSRGIPRELAERLIVMGFVDAIIQQVPCEPLQQRLREELEGGLSAETP